MILGIGKNKNKRKITISRDKLDDSLAREAARHGWAENKTDLAARIIRYVIPYCDEIEMRQKMRDVVKYLENLRIED